MFFFPPLKQLIANCWPVQMGRIPPSAALLPSERKCDCEWGCVPVGLHVWETARMLQLMFQLSVNNS